MAATAEGRAARAAREQASERGQTLVVVAVALLLLAGFMALSLDLGMVHVERRRMQNAADAGALAGARALALGQDPLPAVRQYAQTLNGAESTQVTLTSTTVTVTASKVYRTHFASLLGVPTMTVGATAVAGYSFPRSFQGGGLLPIAVAQQAIRFLGGETIIFDCESEPSNPDQGRISSSHRGWLNYNGGNNSNSDLKDWAEWGYPGMVQAGTWINGSPGTRTSALRATGRWIGQVVFVPVYDRIRTRQQRPPGEDPGNGAQDYFVVGFAAFRVTELKDTGNPKYLKGRFVRWVESQESGGTVDVGVRVVTLQR